MLKMERGIIWVVWRYMRATGRTSTHQISKRHPSFFIRDERCPAWFLKCRTIIFVRPFFIAEDV